MSNDRVLRVGLLGAGTVGAEVARLMVANQVDLAARAGVGLIVTKISVRDLNIPRPGIDPSSSQLIQNQSSLIQILISSSKSWAVLSQLVL